MADYKPSSPTSIIALSQPRDDDGDDQTTAIRRSKISGESRRSISASLPKPRGRPPGSKNKPKPPLVITRDSETSMQTLILDLAAGSDILRCLAGFARRRRIGLSILAGSGAVSSLALRQPATPSATFTVTGRFDIVSLCGTFPPPPLPPPAAAEAEVSPEFTISVAVARGEVIGGVVAGPVTAAGTVVVVGASFLAAEFQRLPEEVEGGGEEASPAGIPASGQVSHDMVLWATPASSRSFSGALQRRALY